MRKKIMSCVVALAFMFSIASQAVYAAPSGASATSAADSGQAVLKDKDDKGSNGPVVNADNSKSREEVNKIVYRFTQVLKYEAGVLVAAIDAAGALTLFENQMARASFLKNEEGYYALATFNFMPGDINIINNMPGANGAEKMKNFLISIGAGNMLQVDESRYDKDGNLEAYETTESYTNREIKPVDLGWFGALYDHLSKGIAYSASIDWQASGGATCTLMHNGQPQVTYAAQPDANGNAQWTTIYNYENGFLISTKSRAYKVNLDSMKSDNDETRKQVEKDLAKEFDDKKSHTYEEMQALYSQYSGAFSFSETYNMTYMGPYGNPAYITDAAGKVTAKYNYSSTNSIESMQDFITGDTSYFGLGGKFIYSINSAGFIKSKMEYNQDGTQNAMYTYNNGVMTQMSVFINNQLALTLSMANGEFVSANQARELYKQIKDPSFKYAMDWYNKEATADQKAEIDKLNALELYETTYTKDDKDNVDEHKGNAVNNDSRVNIQYAYINHLIDKYGIVSFAVYGHDLFNKAIMRVLGLDEAFELALMRKMESDAKAELASLPSEDELKKVWDSLDTSEQEALKKYKEAAEEADKEGDTSKTKENSNALNAEAAKLSETAQYYAYNKTKRIESQNTADRNNSANREAASKTIKKALKLMSMFNNAYAAVLQASFTVTDSIFNKTGATTYTDENGNTITAQEADARMKSDGSVDQTNTTGSGNQVRETSRTENKHTITKSTERSTVTKKSISIAINICAYGQSTVGYSADHTISEKETPLDPNVTKMEYSTFTVNQQRYNSDPVVIGTQGGFVGADGQVLGDYDKDGNLVRAWSNEEIAAYIGNGGVVYVAVNASEINIMDGQGFQQAAGETILVQVTDSEVFKTLADNVGKPVMLMGDVTNDVDGKKTMVMNVNYGGGFRTGEANITDMKNEIIALEGAVTPELLSLIANDKKNGMSTDQIIEKYGWVASNSSDNSWLRGIPGSLDAKWDMLVMNKNSGNTLQNRSKAALVAMSLGLTASNALF